MSNTVRRPRRRPRVHSVSWRSFAWLLRRAAVYALYREDISSHEELAVRSWLRDLSARELRAVLDREAGSRARGYEVRWFRG